MKNDAEHCLEMIAREERLAAQAATFEELEDHLDQAILYRHQYKTLVQRLDIGDVAAQLNGPAGVL